MKNNILNGASYFNARLIICELYNLSIGYYNQYLENSFTN